MDDIVDDNTTIPLSKITCERVITSLTEVIRLRDTEITRLSNENARLRDQSDKFKRELDQANLATINAVQQYIAESGRQFPRHNRMP